MNDGGGAMKLELRKIGNSTGVILPKELLARLNLQQGDSLFVTEGADGDLRLVKHDPDIESAMAVARRGMKRYSAALRELAK
jgi:putative addiction module antidote